MSNLEMLTIALSYLKMRPDARIFASTWFYFFLSDIVDDPSTHDLLCETVKYIEMSTNLLSVLELDALKNKLGLVF